MYPESIRLRLRLAAGGIAVALLCAATLGWWTVSRLSHDIERSVTGAARVQALTNRFAFDVADELRAGEAYLLHRDARSAAEFVDRGRDAHRIQSILIRSELSSAEQGKAVTSELIARIDAELSELESAYARAHRLADLGEPAAAQAAMSGRGTSESGLRHDVARLSTIQADRVAELGASVRRTAVTRAALLAVVLLGVVLVIAALAWQLSRSIARPLAALGAHATALQHGMRDTRTDSTGFPAEFQVLATAMNQATTSLESLARTEAALHQAEKLAAIGTLISGVAHELNNPLQTILLTTEYVRHISREPAVRDELAGITEQVDRASTIIKDLLTAVRQDKTMRDVALLETTLCGLERELMLIARRHGAALDLVVESPLPPVLVDRVGLAQVVTNLVGNAAFAAGDGGLVSLRAGRTAAGCEIVVDDSGPGIPAESINRIFEPFYSTKDVGQGTGLGLSVSRGIVESMRGTLTAECHGNGPASGARFRVTLPIGCGSGATPPSQYPVETDRQTDAPGSLPPLRSLAIVSPAVAQPRMLIVDDEPGIRSLLRRVFLRRGWTVDVACDGAEALEAIQTQFAGDDPYAIVFCDLRMPKMSGIELHDALADRVPAAVERLVFLSGDIVSSDVAEFLQRSSCRIFCKPVDIVELESAAAAAAAALGRVTDQASGALRASA